MDRNDLWFTLITGTTVPVVLGGTTIGWNLGAAAALRSDYHGPTGTLT